ncbi:MAG: hypothetical protein HDQ88_09365 [Clostridia bacterium]|nr:hypothetical protein [Clostridia bacterium]
MEQVRLLCRVDKVAYEARRNPKVKEAAVNYIRLVMDRFGKAWPYMEGVCACYLDELIDLPEDLG